METSEGFRNGYNFLSNFTYFDKPWSIRRGETQFVFTSNEHFYQACKFKDYQKILEVSEHPSRGLKKFINKEKSQWRFDWDDIKLGVMEAGLRYKFSDNNPLLRDKLLTTGDIELVEYNWWNDTFWGVSLKTGEGENNLGKLLMKRREELKIG